MEQESDETEAFEGDQSDPDAIVAQSNAESSDGHDLDSLDDSPADSDDATDIDDSTELADEFEDKLDETEFEPDGRKRKKTRIFCFECNRLEGHSLYVRSRWFYSYLLGLTFGLVTIVGPYQCQCCGQKRLMCRDFLNLRYWFRTANRVDSKKSK